MMATTTAATTITMLFQRLANLRIFLLIVALNSVCCFQPVAQQPCIPPPFSLFGLALHASVGSDQAGDDAPLPTRASADDDLYSLDPTSSAARSLVRKTLGLSETVYEKLVQLCVLVTEWNEHINLVSRKDCNPSTVFGRHVLPCIAATVLNENNDDDTRYNNNDNPLATAQRVIDVGTGGGFPGLPLAILHPTVQFVLLDSVGKKLTAVQEIAKALRLENVQVHHGRAEDWLPLEPFDVALGRSVSPIPQFCACTHHLLTVNDQTRSGEAGGCLMYWIGGHVPEDLLSQAVADVAIQDLLPTVESDKRILIFPAAAVSRIATASGIKVQRQKQQSSADNILTKTSRKSDATGGMKNRSKKKAKGAWDKRNRNDERGGGRGYDNFQRYSSTSWTLSGSNGNASSSDR